MGFQVEQRGDVINVGSWSKIFLRLWLSETGKERFKGLISGEAERGRRGAE